MFKTVSFLSTIKDFIISEQTNYGYSKGNWTRHRKLPFDKVVLMILRNHKLPIQNGLNRLFKEFGEVTQVPTTSAFSQARRKLNPLFFKDWNGWAIKHFYQLNQNEMKLWQGKQLLGVDAGSCSSPK